MAVERAAIAPSIRLSTPVTELPGVGPVRARALARLDIHNVLDLLRHYPLRHERHSAQGAITDLTYETIGSVRGTIVNTRWMAAAMGRGRARFEATLQDHSGRLALVWFNAGYLRQRLRPGMTIRVQGKVAAFRGYPQMVNPRWEEQDLAQPRPESSDRLVAVYPATENLPARFIQELIESLLPVVLPQIADPLPAALARDHNMPSLADAFGMIHQPADQDQAAAARRRLAFNELLLLQLGIAINRHYNRQALQAPALRWSPAIDTHIRARFPFLLTAAQDRVIHEIAQDLQREQPMNRLLQGDVGSGKTVVALYALLMAVADRRQGALMAPTELLAEQHFLSVSRMLEGSNVRLALLTAGSGTPAQRRQTLQRVAAGEVDIVVGTQALLTESVRFADLAVVVIDEQHRFGVLQRAAFKQPIRDGGPTGGRRPSPHCLVMTATPIPRSLSLTIFGDLDMSTIDSLPPGRSPIETQLVEPGRVDDLYRDMARRVAAGEQAYVVVPAIDAQGRESAAPLKDLRSHVELLTDKFCRRLNVAAVHSRLKADSRQEIMRRFHAGDIHVLVATTVIEVGVDVPNATIMIIEHAERFGLAQLHQLRGRVGRGDHGRPSLCALVGEAMTPQAQARLRAVADTTDGFRIAQADLEIRGMGDFFGTRQHGLPPLRLASIPQDMDLLQLARRDAQAIVEADPTLAFPEHHRLRKVLLQHYGDVLGLVDVG